MRPVFHLHNQRPNLVPLARQEYLLDRLSPLPKPPQMNGKRYRPLLLHYFVYPPERVHRASVSRFLHAPVDTLESTAPSRPTSLRHRAEFIVGEENLGVIGAEVGMEVVFWRVEAVFARNRLGTWGYGVLGGPFDRAPWREFWRDGTRFVHSHVRE